MLDLCTIKDTKHNINQYKCQAKLDKCLSCQCIVNNYFKGRIVLGEYGSVGAKGLRPATDTFYKI
jgi:hypothetical protein